MPHSWKMDIQRWLDETVTPEQPRHLPEASATSFCTPLERAERPDRRRERTPSDSSFLDIALPSKPASDAIHPNHRPGSDCSAHDYSRRPRHKTRIERYEATSRDRKKRGVHGRRREQGESAKAKPRHKRKKIDRERGERVQSFHANNVSADRLTLKPQAKLGLFNKGRASSPVKGRGLPDLVFSEMKFLRRRDNDQAEPQSQLGAHEKESRHQHAQPNEEISTYFTARQPAQAEGNTTTHAKDEPLFLKPAQHPSSTNGHALPTVEVTERMSHRDSNKKRSRDSSESCVSWSESIRAPSVVQTFHPVASTPNVGQPGYIHHDRAKWPMDDSRRLYTRDASPNTIKHISEINGGFLSSLHSANDRNPPSPSPISQPMSLLRQTNPAVRTESSPKLVDRVSPTHVRSSVHDTDTWSEQIHPGSNLLQSLESRVTHSPTSHERLMPTECAHYSRVMRDIPPREHSTEAEPLSLRDVWARGSERFIRSPGVEKLQHSMVENSKPSKVPVLGIPKTLSNFSFSGRRTLVDPCPDMHASHRPCYVRGPPALSIYEQQAQRELGSHQEAFNRPKSLAYGRVEEGLDLGETGAYGEHTIVSYGLDPVFYGPECTDMAYELAFTHEIGEEESCTSATVQPGFWRPHRLYY